MDSQHQIVPFKRVHTRNPTNDENTSRDLINALTISNINRRDHLIRRLHYKLLGFKRITCQKIEFYHSKDFNR